MAAAKAKPPPSGERISINEALQRLLAAYPPHDAADRLNAGLHKNSVQMWCNGGLLSPNYIRTELVVQAVQEADGRWRADVVPARGAWEDQPYIFEVDEGGVAALLRSAPPRRPPGPKPTGDWHTEVAAWLINGGPRRSRRAKKYRSIGPGRARSFGTLHRLGTERRSRTEAGDPAPARDTVIPHNST